MNKAILILTAALMLSACGQIEKEKELISPADSAVHEENQYATNSMDEEAGNSVIVKDEAASYDEDSSDIRLMVNRTKINVETDECTEYCAPGEVIFSAEVPVDCSPEKVRLINADTGEAVAEMFDEADFQKYGDSIKGEGVYCCRYMFDLDIDTQPDVSEDVIYCFYAEFDDESGAHRSDKINICLYESFTDKELDGMETVDNEIQQAIGSEEYKQFSDEEKIETVVALLNELADRGLVVKESVNVSGDMVVFKYSAGGHGGVQIKPFDEKLN